MAETNLYDVAVIGAGPGGYPAALEARARGAKVLLLEKGHVGGLCLNLGCIPSKSYLDVGHKLAGFKALSALAEEPAALKLSWEKIRRRKDSAVSFLRGSIERTLKAAGVELVRAEGRFLSDKEIEAVSASGRRSVYAFRSAIVAAGTRPFFPPPFDAHAERLLDSDRIFDLSETPRRLAVIGGGAIGCELSCFFSEMGSEIVLIEKMPRLLPGEDEGVARLLQGSFEKRGIRVAVGATVEELAPQASGWKLRLAGGESLQADQVLVCVGRRAHAEGLGLEKAGVPETGSFVGVDGFLRTPARNIFAVGDINGLAPLAHAATAQGISAARSATGDLSRYDGSLVPRCLYTWPEVASVGLWKRDCLAQGIEIKAQRFFFAASGRALTEGETEGYMQILSDAATGRILGAQMIGPRVTELIHIISMAIRSGMGRGDFKGMIFAHPTLAEGIRETLER
ncbi:MAG: dihydrolipoyl dehydrogenase [Elusimicrobia bacterium RIFCSPLOWO2_12_FULL_59_9]|nr:MAG: dihydrolipoyl dehydrogenase [Elusimicrobia bacterium RIFCSPLOWO2_12_FULL_59_9]